MDLDIIKIGRTLILFIITAITEILGCYFPYLILNQHKTAWLWLPTIMSLAAFVWLLTLHPESSGRIYAAYGGIYILVALMWLKWVDQSILTRWDVLGGFVILVGALMIILQPQSGLR